MLNKTAGSKATVIVALVLIVVGLKFASMGSGAGNVQNDGYNVTGAILCLLGGVLVGMWVMVSDRKGESKTSGKEQ